jgi:hypothetical protein
MISCRVPPAVMMTGCAIRPPVDQGDQEAAVDQRCAGESPVERPLAAVGAVVLHVVLLPLDRAALHVEAQQLAVGARHVDAIAVHRGRRSRTIGP